MKTDELLPELRTNDILITKGGQKISVIKVRKPKRNTECDEPLYKIVHYIFGRTVTSAAEWTREEIQEAGARMAE